LALSFSAGVIADERPSAPDLTVHEWGTFTAIAGSDGRAMNWVPWRAPEDLPQFVEHIEGVSPKAGLQGTIRMETPVMYFYSPRDIRVSARVSFSKGVITEWYPHATHVQAGLDPRSRDLGRVKSDGAITWKNVVVSPNLAGEFRREEDWNHYYAARETASAALRVKAPSGEQQEKFLFYRGVSAAPLPITGTQTANGQLLVTNLGDGPIPEMVLFERRGARVGYRFVHAPAAETNIAPPVLNGSVDALCEDLERTLVEQGLYADEAHAMVNTWRDSWFEEGSRLIYIVPRNFVDTILPLTLEPKPGQVVRVFVGRLEIVTPATENAVQTALRDRDEATLKKYDRFLGPILQLWDEKHPESRQ
jgi:hypothetical protein